MKRSIKKIVFTVITFSLTCLMLSSCLWVAEKKDRKIEAKIEDCIEKGDFQKAKQLNKKMFEPRACAKSICKAQVSSLIDEGQFHLAADIAKEDVDYGVYYEVLMGKLTQLYDSNPQGLMIALSSITFPRPYEGSWDVSWNGSIIGRFEPGDLNHLYESFNNNLKQLLYYAKNKNDMEFVQMVSAFLKPMYKKVKSKGEKWDSKLEEFVAYDCMDWEDSASDYTQANQIKKELGIK